MEATAVLKSGDRRDGFYFPKKFLESIVFIYKVIYLFLAKTEGNVDQIIQEHYKTSELAKMGLTSHF